MIGQCCVGAGFRPAPCGRWRRRVRVREEKQRDGVFVYIYAKLKCISLKFKS